MEATINIVELIENNPIIQLSTSYQNKFLTKIKENFTDTEQHLFVSSFYCFLKYDKKEFVIDLDDIWQWLGFGQKVNAKRLLEKNFTIDKDYKSLLCQQAKQTTVTKGGHNKETFLLNTVTFKKFCLKAGTKKADEIHDYYIRLEETLQELIQQESNELKNQLEQKDKLIENKQKDSDKIREKTLIEQFPNNTQCIYYGTIDNVSDNNEKLIKFGNSNNLKNRVIRHRETYLNFRLINVFKVDNKIQIENAIKNSEFFNQRQRNITLKNKKYIELLTIENITFIEIDKKIKEVITSIQYSPENYFNLLNENILLKQQLEQSYNSNNTTQLVLLTSENKKLKTQNINLLKKINKLLYKTTDTSTDTSTDIITDNDELHDVHDLTNYDTTFFTLNQANKIHKNIDGTYLINMKKYSKLCGSREEVFNEHAYKTTGGLIKNDLIIKNGKIISKKKSIQETMYDRFVKCGINKS